jgi:geranylgeranyl pyrophosphate synthase
VELEHTASLLHDDVVDEAATRRSETSHCAKFGSRTSVLHGDYLVAMVVDRLSKIGDSDVTVLVANSMLELVRGELLQVANDAPRNTASHVGDERFMCYVEKSFCKTAALFAAVVESFAQLAHKNVEIFRRVGANVGLAFQLVDDCLDFEASAEELGKPGHGSDFAHGHLTAPVLLAEEPVRRALIGASVADAVALVRRGGGIARTRSLACALIQEAKTLLTEELPISQTRDTLFDLLDAIVTRNK